MAPATEDQRPRLLNVPHLSDITWADQKTNSHTRGQKKNFHSPFSVFCFLVSFTDHPPTVMQAQQIMPEHERSIVQIVFDQ